jgi:hypothetical protein
MFSVQFTATRATPQKHIVLPRTRRAIEATEALIDLGVVGGLTLIGEGRVKLLLV